jgi:predicted O-methyltransferase YrrM
MAGGILSWLRTRAAFVPPADVSRRVVRMKMLVAFDEGVASYKDYSYRLESRQGYGKPPLESIARLIRPREGAHAAWLAETERFADRFAAISIDQPDDARQPFWCNGWMPGLDAALLYAMIATKKPKLYLEIGSGNSTKFVRRAIADHGLSTRIESIDPQPRAEIDSLCDTVHRKGLEDADLTVFDKLEAGDVVFFDGSHRCLQNSDVTVFFLEVLPNLPKGILIGIHDIFLPSDYPLDWQKRMYNEQYMLAAWLLGANDPARIEFAGIWASDHQPFAPAIERILAFDPARKVERHAGAFWITA